MRTMKQSWYHSILRVSVVVLAVSLAFDSGLFNPVTADMSQATQSYLANAVGVSVAIAPNELNVITAELTAREQELAAREAALEQREIDVGIDRESPASAGTNTSTYIIAGLLFILLLLMVLNYAMDFARARRLEELAS